jgi:hypothetical protein
VVADELYFDPLEQPASDITMTATPMDPAAVSGHISFSKVESAASCGQPGNSRATADGNGWSAQVWAIR